MATIQKYEYLWNKDTSDWVLFRLNPDSTEEEPEFSIINISNKHGLIIEDNDVNRAVIQKMLSAGVRILTAADWANIGQS